MDRKYSDGTVWGNSIDWDDAPDGSDGGYSDHGSYIIPPAMREIVSLRAANESLRSTISRLREYVRDCATNWDCDEDAHTYRTTCRKCDAEALLAAMAGGEHG